MVKARPCEVTKINTHLIEQRADGNVYAMLHSQLVQANLALPVRHFVLTSAAVVSVFFYLKPKKRKMRKAEKSRRIALHLRF